MGAVIVIWDFWIACGILIRDDDKGRFVCGQGYAEKWVFPVGDELSVRRVFEFFDDVLAVLNQKQSTYQSAYLQAMELVKLIPQVVPVGGDLHLRFHLLDAIYRLFYGGFLQPLQWILGWKHVNGKDVSKTFQKCDEMAGIVYDGVDRVMCDVFLVNHVVPNL